MRHIGSLLLPSYLPSLSVDCAPRNPTATRVVEDKTGRILFRMPYRPDAFALLVPAGLCGVPTSTASLGKKEKRWDVFFDASVLNVPEWEQLTMVREMCRILVTDSSLTAAWPTPAALLSSPRLQTYQMAMHECSLSRGGATKQLCL